MHAEADPIPPPMPWRSEAFFEDLDLLPRPLAVAGPLPRHQKPTFSVSRSVRGSAGWTWRSATAAASPGSRDS